MEKEVKRLHKLALPLVVERTGNALIVSDGLFEKSFEFKDFGKLRVTSIDTDGFVTFELLAAQQKTLTDPQTTTRTVTAEVGYVLIGSSTAKSTSGNLSRGTYEYYKRASDESYYALIKIGSRHKKMPLGSIMIPTSRMSQIMIATKTFTDWFDRPMLLPRLSTVSIRHGQRLKAVLDILVIEGYLERKDSLRSGRAHEQYKRTAKIPNS